MNYKRNNLDKAKSPYLLQHKDNPIWWQEWNYDVLKYAEENKKLIFVSSGYSTCHWCHVMAADSFSDESVAKKLNQDYICIKIDREERPDIDHYLMEFMTENYGNGGWPLNVIMTPNKMPFFAATYIGSKPRYGMSGFLDLLEKIEDFYLNNGANLKRYELRKNESQSSDLLSIENLLKNYFDDKYGGFGNQMKFPPHNTLLFLIHHYEETKDVRIKEIIEKTLESIAQYGLHDHIRGGFFRYCVDREWGIPHFEKMLYDQAMLLMVFSAAYKAFKVKTYKDVVVRLFECLKTDFESNGLFVSAFDADTNHAEGKTYLWSPNELESILGNKFGKFQDIYNLLPFEGEYHLHRKQLKFDNEIDSLLLNTRYEREQPFKDEKILTSWNSLLGIAFIYAYRAFRNNEYLDYALNIYKNISEKLINDDILFHSMLNDELSMPGLLEDYSSYLLFLTYLNEEIDIDQELILKYSKRVNSFKVESIWYESIDSELGMIAAKEFDHPTPSSVSLAKCAILRANLIFNSEYSAMEFKQGSSYDFYNLTVLLSRGLFIQITSNKKIDNADLPLNSIFLKGEENIICHKGACVKYTSAEELLEEIKKG